jgi:hypothetical protein
MPRCTEGWLASMTSPRRAPESSGETWLRWTLRLMGYHPLSQFRIEDGPFLAVVDFLLEEARVAIELDGFVKYERRSPFALSAQPAEIVAAEKVREDHVRELAYGFGGSSGPTSTRSPS